MTTRDGYHVKTVKLGEAYVLQRRTFVPGRANRTEDEIHDDINSGRFEWCDVSMHSSFAEAQWARDMANSGESSDPGFDAFLANQPLGWAR